MKTKANTVSSKTSARKSSVNRERDKKKLIASESGSSQCETPPHTDKDAGTSSTMAGKFAGISPESINCMAEQIGVDVTPDALTNLAEDVSYKVRQVINNIALLVQHANKSQTRVSDVNSVLKLMDCPPVLGAGYPHWVNFGDENLCCEQDVIVDLTELSTIPQQYILSSSPSLNIDWVLEEKSIPSGSRLSSALKNYYTKISRVIINGSENARRVALTDLSLNGKIGPVIPHYFNLAVLILNDDNLNALNIIEKIPLQTRILNMIEALCHNACSPDTNIQEQLQRLFPVMVSNILGNGLLSRKLLSVLNMIIRTWPSFRNISMGILNEYLCQNVKERLSRGMLDCLCALGRQTLVHCLSSHLDFIDECLHNDDERMLHPALYDGLLNVATLLMKPEPVTFLEDYVMTDYTLYEMIGDAQIPRRILSEIRDPESENSAKRKLSGEDVFVPLFKSKISRIHIKILTQQAIHTKSKYDTWQPIRCHYQRTIRVNIQNSRPIQTKPSKTSEARAYFNSYTQYFNTGKCVVVSCGALNKARFKMPVVKTTFPLFGMYTL